MIDIHSHILPGLDDGPTTLEECVAMVRLAASSGTTTMVATPHADLRYLFDPARVTEAAAELEAAAGAGISIRTGCDFHLTADNLHDALDHPHRYTLNQQNYLLIELPDHAPKALLDIAGHLIAAGLVPIVTHPERHSLLKKHVEQLEAWIERGCLVQITAQSLLGQFGSSAESAAWRMLKKGYVHFVASDAHDPVHRPPTLDRARGLVARRYGDALAECLFVDNPRAAVEGTSLPAQPRPARRWFPWP